MEQRSHKSPRRTSDAIIRSALGLFSIFSVVLAVAVVVLALETHNADKALHRANRADSNASTALNISQAVQVSRYLSCLDTDSRHTATENLVSQLEKIDSSPKTTKQQIKAKLDQGELQDFLNDLVPHRNCVVYVYGPHYHGILPPVPPSLFSSPPKTKKK